MQGSKISFSDDSAEVIIVPDGTLWYLPFEMLPLGAESKEFKPLINRSRVRYAPTVGLALPMRQGRTSSGEYGIVEGKLYPTDKPDIERAAVEEVRRATPNSVVLRNPLPGPSPLVGAMFDGLIVLDDLTDTQSGYDWSPIPLERGKGAGSLAAWMTLPWKDVDQFVLPGYHTAAENALKSPGSSPGNELFQSTMGMMACGARTALVSRWRTGGQSAIELTREFVQELPFVTAAESWQRAVQLISQSPLDADSEPRLAAHKAGSAEAEAPKGSHPFFWAGYMLVDSGTTPEQKEKQPDKPVLKFVGGKAGDGNGAGGAAIGGGANGAAGNQPGANAAGGNQADGNMPAAGGGNMKDGDAKNAGGEKAGDDKPSKEKPPEPQPAEMGPARTGNGPG